MKHVRLRDHTLEHSHCFAHRLRNKMPALPGGTLGVYRNFDISCLSKIHSTYFILQSEHEHMMGDQTPAPLDQPNPLVSTPATQLLSSQAESAFVLPTPLQLAAVIELKDLNEDKTFAWLAFARSLEDGFQYRNAPEGLSYSQFDAVCNLRDCSDSSIITWLQYVALTGELI